MRIRVLGDGPTARMLRGRLQNHSDALVVNALPDFTVKLEEQDGFYPYVDSVDGPLEAAVVRHLSELLGTVLVKRHGGNQRDDTVVVTVPIGREDDASRGLFRALTGGMVKKRGWWRRRLW